MHGSPNLPDWGPPHSNQAPSSYTERSSLGSTPWMLHLGTPPRLGNPYAEFQSVGNQLHVRRESSISSLTEPLHPHQDTSSTSGISTSSQGSIGRYPRVSASFAGLEPGMEDMPDQPFIWKAAGLEKRAGTSAQGQRFIWSMFRVAFFLLVALLLLNQFGVLEHTFITRRVATLASRHCPNQRTTCYLQSTTLTNRRNSNSTEGVPPLAVESITLSETSISAVVKTLKSRRIIEELEHALARGVKVKVLMEYLSTRKEIDGLLCAGVELMVWDEAYNFTKFGVYDSKLIVSGVGNWMEHERKEQPSLVFVSESRDLIADLAGYFELLWRDAQEEGERLVPSEDSDHANSDYADSDYEDTDHGDADQMRLLGKGTGRRVERL